MVRPEDEVFHMMKDIVLLFALLACVGSFYHAKLLAGFAYMAAAGALYYEKTIRGWFRSYFSS